MKRNMGLGTVESQVHVLRLQKGREHFVFIYDRDHVSDVLHTLSRWASTPDIDLSWYDAARLSHEVRNW
jgi:hypothetical protein